MAGKKGGRKTSSTRQHMVDIGRKGGKQRAVNAGQTLREKSPELIELENKIFPE